MGFWGWLTNPWKIPDFEMVESDIVTIRVGLKCGLLVTICQCDDTDVDQLMFVMDKHTSDRTVVIRRTEILIDEIAYFDWTRCWVDKAIVKKVNE